MKTYGDYLSSIFPDFKVQKISVNAGFTCPNRDGSISTEGCIYCRNDSFSPGYCDASLPVKLQLEKGKQFFSRKYPEMKFLAYFQSFTGTYGKPVDELEKLYEEALSVKDVVGLVIGTRPDCISEPVIDLLQKINQKKPVIVEIGAESSHCETLTKINRNHNWDVVENTVRKLSKIGIHIGLHLIVGLPGETFEMVLQTIDNVIKLPIETIKLHQLQVLKGTPLLKKIEAGILSVPEFSLDEYVHLCAEIVKRVPDNIVIERFLAQSPPDLVVTPSWGLKNYQFMSKLERIIDAD